MLSIIRSTSQPAQRRSGKSVSRVWS